MSSEDVDADLVDHSDEDFSTAAMGSGGESSVEAVEDSDGGEKQASDDGDEPEDITATITTADAVDWEALFVEMDAHTPDAAGQRMLSDTQMPAALAGSEQDISDAVDPDDAVEAGLLDEVPGGYQHEVCRR